MYEPWTVLQVYFDEKTVHMRHVHVKISENESKQQMINRKIQLIVNYPANLP